MNIRSIRKAIVAAVGVAVTLGVLDPGTAQDIAGLLTAIAVFFVPNES